MADMTTDTQALVDAARALLIKLDEALPHISNAILIATNHHCPYEGPAIDGEMEALRKAIRAQALADLAEGDGPFL